jgi:hypothetical protein
MAALLACGDAAVLSHVSAASLWRLVAPALGPVHVTVSDRARRRRGIIVHRSRTLTQADRRRRHGIAATSVERTLLDLAATASPTQLRHAFEEAERLELLRRAALEGLCERMRGRRGLGTLRGLLGEAPLPLSEARSTLEARFLAFCRDRGLPIPAVDVPVGEFIVDFLWPEHRVVAELDSWTHHGRRNSFESDRERDVRIQLAGYRVIRITHRRLDRPVQLDADLRRLLALSGGL